MSPSSLHSLAIVSCIVNGILGEWEMVFRATSGVDGVLLNTWKSTGGINEQNTTLRSVYANATGVFRSSLIDNWEKENIAQVKVSVYSGGKEKANITFEAFGSNNLTWFSPPHILSATYSDIHAATASVFSVEGFHSEKVSRVFYASNVPSDCNGDKAWIMVIDSGGTGNSCAYDSKADKPYFLYCPTTTACSAKSQMLLGDVFTVHIARGPYHTGPSLMGMWYFGMYSGGLDFSGHENHAHLSGVSYTSGPKGEVNGAVQFTASENSYIEIPNNGKLDVVRSYTLMMQVYTQGDPDGPFFSYEGYNRHYNCFWEYYGTNTLYVGINNRTNGHKIYEYSTYNILRTNTWDFVTVAYDYSAGKLYIYRDDKLFATYSPNQTVTGTQSKVRVAARPDDSRRLKARVSCYQLYNYALSVSEIKAYKFRCQNSVPQVMTPSLVGMWYFSRMYRGQDLSGYGNLASLHDVTYEYGPLDDAFGAVQLSGTCTSYIEIPNNGMLDVVHSFTLMMQLYTQGDPSGPLFNYENSTGGHYLLFWEAPSTKTFHYNIYDRNMKSRASKNVANVFRTNHWDFLVVTYDYSSGHIKVYRNEEEKSSQDIGKIDLGTNHKVRIGVRHTSDARCLKVRLSCYQLYNYAMTTADQLKYRNRCQDYIGVKNRMFIQNYGASKELRGHALMSTVTRSSVECASLCTEASDCGSYNYNERTGACSLRDSEEPERHLTGAKDNSYFHQMNHY